MVKPLHKKTGTGRVRAEEIDAVIGDYIDPSSLLCTDTATNYKKFALIKEHKHETINLSKEGYVKKRYITSSARQQLSQAIERLDATIPRCGNQILGQLPLLLQFSSTE